MLRFPRPLLVHNQAVMAISRYHRTLVRCMAVIPRLIGVMDRPLATMIVLPHLNLIIVTTMAMMMPGWLRPSSVPSDLATC